MIYENVDELTCEMCGTIRKQESGKDYVQCFDCFALIEVNVHRGIDQNE